MPRRAPLVADDLMSLRLGPHCFAHLRAVAEGVPVAESAQRYLAIEHGNQAPSAHRLLVECQATPNTAPLTTSRTDPLH